MAWTFGNLSPGLTRDADDLYFTQLASAYWAEFIKSGQPVSLPSFVPLYVVLG